MGKKTVSVLAHSFLLPQRAKSANVETFNCLPNVGFLLVNSQLHGENVFTVEYIKILYIKVAKTCFVCNIVICSIAGNLLLCLHSGELSSEEVVLHLYSIIVNSTSTEFSLWIITQDTIYFRYSHQHTDLPALVWAGLQQSSQFVYCEFFDKHSWIFLQVLLLEY